MSIFNIVKLIIELCIIVTVAYTVTKVTIKFNSTSYLPNIQNYHSY